ncbi:MAG: hypothetical protein CVU81_01390, partial [Euryarchaeota archaeon HGW-Euryarchaeota-1]
MPFGFDLPFGKKKDDDELLKDLENLDSDKNTSAPFNPFSTSNSASSLDLQPPMAPNASGQFNSSSNTSNSFSSAPSGFMGNSTPAGFSQNYIPSSQFSQSTGGQIGGQAPQDAIQQRITQILDQIQSQNIKYEQLKVELGTISINLEIIKRQLEQIKLKIDN